eukprot:15465511-Alexandrium_andersonii.AAC.1
MPPKSKAAPPTPRAGDGADVPSGSDTSQYSGFEWAPQAAAKVQFKGQDPKGKPRALAPPPTRPRTVPPPPRDFPAGSNPALFALPAPGDPPALSSLAKDGAPHGRPRGLAWKSAPAIKLPAHGNQDDPQAQQEKPSHKKDKKDGREEKSRHHGKKHKSRKDDHADPHSEVEHGSFAR